MSVNDFDLSSCGVPAESPAHVVLTVKSSNILGNAQAQLSEGSLSCQVTATVGGYADCVVTVTDGVLDQYQSSNVPENYRLEVTWDETATVITGTNIYTMALTSGDVLSVQRSVSYGEAGLIGVVSIFFLVMIVFAFFMVLK